MDPTCIPLPAAYGFTIGVIVIFTIALFAVGWTRVEAIKDYNAALDQIILLEDEKTSLAIENEALVAALTTANEHVQTVVDRIHKPDLYHKTYE